MSSMDLETLLKRHHPAAEAGAPSGGGAGAASGCASAHQEAPDKKKQKLAEMAEAADEALLWAVGALKQKDMQQGLMVIKAGRAAGKQCSQAAQIEALKPQLGPPHLHIARAAYKCLAESTALQTNKPQAHLIADAFYRKFASVASVKELALM
ncbi:unnamed protein product, partial [Prorocentrum cordatum]